MPEYYDAYVAQEEEKARLEGRIQELEEAVQDLCGMLDISDYNNVLYGNDTEGGN